MTSLAAPIPAAAAARAVVVQAFWRHARFGLLAAQRDDRVVAGPHRLALVEMWVHGPAWLQRRASAAIMAMDAALPPVPAPGPRTEPRAAEPPVELMEPAPPLCTPPERPHAAAVYAAVETMDGWLRLFCPWWR